MPFEKIHLTDLNEYLAGAVVKGRSPVEAEIKDYNADGFINIEIHISEKEFYGPKIDFDLQGCECSGLNEHDDISDYAGKTICTSSAYEFVEFTLSVSDHAELLVNIEEGTWVISLLSYS